MERETEMRLKQEVIRIHTLEIPELVVSPQSQKRHYPVEAVTITTPVIRTPE